MGKIKTVKAPHCFFLKINEIADKQSKPQPELQILTAASFYAYFPLKAFITIALKRKSGSLFFYHFLQIDDKNDILILWKFVNAKLKKGRN